MKIISDIREMQETCLQIRKSGRTIGFVPTMGFLHEGHLSLLDIAKNSADVAVMSIYVNPYQFGPNEDFSSYPRDLEKDQSLAEGRGCDILFTPDDKQIYPEPYNTYVEVSGLTESLCGVSRPGHFKGVATIVCKLFQIVQPDHAVFGQKDAQQFAVLQKMVRDLNIPVKMVSAPILREADGLAMSSRNRYLNEAQRKNAAILYRSLQSAEKLVLSGEKDTGNILSAVREKISEIPEAEIDYIQIVDAESMRPQTRIDGNRCLLALAVFIGKTRLIDNIILDPGSS